MVLVTATGPEVFVDVSLRELAAGPPVTDRTRRRGIIELSHPVDRLLRVGARSVLLVAIVVFLVQWRLGRLPHVPEGGTLTEDVLGPVQLALIAIVAAGLIVSFRWIATAAVIVAFGGSFMAVLSGLQ